MPLGALNPRHKPTEEDDEEEDDTPRENLGKARPKNESKEEKAKRKQELKEQRRSRRMEKKATKVAFSQELSNMKRQNEIARQNIHFE